MPNHRFTLLSLLLGSVALPLAAAPVGIDHHVTAMAMQSAGGGPDFNYVQFEAPAPAMAALASGDVAAITTEFARARPLAEQGGIRIIGVTAGDGVDLPFALSTLKDQGIDFEFSTSSGFFAAPGTNTDEISQFEVAFSKLNDTDAWEDVVLEKNWIEHRLDSAVFAALLDRQAVQIRDALKALE